MLPAVVVPNFVEQFIHAVVRKILPVVEAGSVRRLEDDYRYD